MSNRDNDNFLFFVLGGLIGGIIALLYAPERGCRTRRKVKNFLNDFKDCSAERMGKFRSRINDLCENGRDMVLEDEENGEGTE